MKSAATIALLVVIAIGVVGGLFFRGAHQPNIALLAPAADGKVAEAYRRAGFGDRLMSDGRRERFSGCYKDMLRRLGLDPQKPAALAGTEGKITVVFHVAENGKLLDSEIIGSDFSDAAIKTCVAQAIAGVHFMPPPLGINRYIGYDFVFKTEETVKKEAAAQGAPSSQSPIKVAE